MPQNVSLFSEVPSTTTAATTTTTTISTTHDDTCLLQNDTNIESPDRTTQVPVRARCQRFCKEDVGAKYFSYKAESGECACKIEDGGRTKNESGFVTGEAACACKFFNYFIGQR